MEVLTFTALLETGIYGISLIYIILFVYSSVYNVNLAFRGQCIVIYSYNESQQDALFLNFILVNNSTCFGQTYYPSS